MSTLETQWGRNSDPDFFQSVKHKITKKVEKVKASPDTRKRMQFQKKNLEKNLKSHLKAIMLYTDH